MSAPRPSAARARAAQRVLSLAMALCLAVMALAVFVNVVLRYGFGSGIAGSEELSRLLFVWMVFIGGAAAYPAGEHMAFTSLLLPLRGKPAALRWMSRLIHGLVALAAGLVAWGAWQQVLVGLGGKSPVMGYSMALVPLPALLCCGLIAVLASVNAVRGKTVDLGHGAEIE
jgi:TRAP-type transport system small permease protein